MVRRQARKCLGKCPHSTSLANDKANTFYPQCFYHIEILIQEAKFLSKDIEFLKYCIAVADVKMFHYFHMNNKS